VVRLLCCLLVALTAGATRVAAHAVLTQSSVRDRPVRPYAATALTLTFNSSIEPGFTQVVLRGEDDERRVAAHPGERPSQVVVDLPPLAPGAYALRYKVLAADGHITESVLRFRVEPE
jgi:methionine-rich copper-binding protein CopC